MGAKLVINGYSFKNIRSWQVTEDSTPLSASDTSGSTGILTATINAPDPDLEHVQDTGMKWLLDYGPNILTEKTLTFTDSRWGTLPGKVTSVSRAPGSITITATTDLYRLNSYNVQAQPFDGTLGNLLRYYVGLSGLPGTPTIDSALNSRPVSTPGWKGELWYYLKLLAQAQEFDIALVNGILVFRLLRQNTVAPGRDTETGSDAPIGTLARSVEVYQWNNRSITNELVYPPGGWRKETEILNVNAGEFADYTLELSASVSSIVAPTFQTSVGPNDSGASVYTVVADDGFPVTQANWIAGGGSLAVTINPDTRSLNVRIRGAHRVPLSTGGWAKNFSIALSDSESRYSTLRILGTGVAYSREKRVFRTGVTTNQTGTEVGATIDNPFLSTKNQVFRAGTRAAVMYAGPVPSLRKNVVTAFPQQTTLGNLSGARVLDKATKRYYRSRSMNISPGGVSGTFDDDLLHGDIDGFQISKTYGQVQASRNGASYRDDYLGGLR